MKTNCWAIYWFVTGLLFLILACINAYQGNHDRAIAMTGISLACQARSEVKILQNRIEKLESLK